MSIKKEIKNTLKFLEEGKIILYPTDTVWGIGCDATDEIAVDKVYSIKKRNESKSMIILIDSIKMLQSIIINIPENIINLIKETVKPTSFIFNNPQKLAKNVIAKDNTVAIRIVKDPFCNQLIKEFGKPIISTSANISNKPTPKSFIEIQTNIIDTVDYTVNLQKNKTNLKPSRIVFINKDGSTTVLRD